MVWETQDQEPCGWERANSGAPGRLPRFSASSPGEKEQGGLASTNGDMNENEESRKSSNAGTSAIAGLE